VSSEIKIGTGLRADFGKNETPGPGAYELFKNSVKGVTISGYKGKQDIEVTPGPGAYDMHEILQRPCSAKYNHLYSESGRACVQIWRWETPQAQASTTPKSPATTSSPTPSSPVPRM